jgi:hypothetical protein
VFEYKVLRRIFGPKSDEIIAGWRKVHNEELRNLLLLAKYYNNQLTEDEMGRACDMHGKEEECIQSFGRKT